MKVIDFIRENGIEELEKLGIKIKKYNDRISLNYKKFDNKFNPVVQECRGLILSYPNLDILARPFKRFYNFGEDPNSNSINISQALIQEKVDGSLIIVYHDNERWEIATRGDAFAEGNTPFGKRLFRDIFIDTFKWSLNEFDLFDKDWTFIFELASLENRVITRYPEDRIYLLGIIDRKTGYEYDVFKCDEIAEYFNIMRPKTYRFRDINDLMENLNSLKDLEEGFVSMTIRSDNYPWNNNIWRLKFKSPQYLSLVNLRGDGLSLKKIIKILSDPFQMNIYLEIYPEDENILLEYKNKINNLKNIILSEYEKYRDIENRKDFAIKIINNKYKDILFDMHKGYKFEDIFSELFMNRKIELIESLEN